MAVVGLLVFMVASTRGDCVLGFGRAAFTGRDGLLYTWIYRNDTPWTTPDVQFRAFAQPTVTWWSFDAGWHRMGWTPIKSVYFVLMPIWVPTIGVALLGAACGWYARRTRVRARAGKCADCGYALAGLATFAVCPECGRKPIAN